MPYCLHIIIVVKPIYQEFFNTIMVGLLLYGASKVEVPGLPYRISRPFGIFRVREHSVSPEALSERAKHASLAAGETIGGASARGKNSTGSAFLYGSPGTSGHYKTSC